MASSKANTSAESSFQSYWKNPYLMHMVFSIGMVGLIFGYDTGAMSRAYPYFFQLTKEDFHGNEDIVLFDGNENIVTYMLASPSWFAAIGAAFGGSFFCDPVNGDPKIILLFADILMVGGTCFSVLHIQLMGWARVLVGVGIGMASMSAPLYISEISPSRIRGALVCTISLLAALGHILSYPICLLASKAPGSWRWMLGVTGILALVHYGLVMALPMSPVRLYRMGEREEAVETLKRLHPPQELEIEVRALQLSVEAEECCLVENEVKNPFCNSVTLKGIVIGVGCQLAQQLVGINMVMFYTPTILGVVGYTTTFSDSNSNMTPLFLITCCLSAIGYIVSTLLVDRVGRRRLLLISMLGCTACLGLLSIALYGAASAATMNSSHAPVISSSASASASASSNNWLEMVDPDNVTCPPVVFNNETNTPYSLQLDCMTCSKLYPYCVYTRTGYSSDPGICVANFRMAVCQSVKDKNDNEWYKKGGSTTTSLRLLAPVVLVLYIIFYSLGMETIPWIINSEIYPFRFRGPCGGAAAFVSFLSSALMSNLLIDLNKVLGSSAGNTFLFFCLVSFVAASFIYQYLPETNGLPIDHIDEDVMFVLDDLV